MLYFIEVVIGGMLSGIMYSLVAIGFVLIYRSSGVFNFAQGTMLLVAALTFVSLTERQVNFWVAFGITLMLMVSLGIIVERFVMRPLVNQSLLALFMATVGLSYFLEGASQLVWDSAVHGLKLGISNDPIFLKEYIPGFDVLISQFDIYAALYALALIVVLTYFFEKRKTGIAIRATSDDQLAALSVGIPIEKIWAIVWAIVGVIGLTVGLMWGDRISVSFTLTTVALKGLPVILIGGLNSIPGAIIGGLLIGVGEKLGEIYLAEYFGGQGIENWFAYAIALIFLLFKPTGMFGEKEIVRV